MARACVVLSLILLLFLLPMVAESDAERLRKNGDKSMRLEGKLSESTNSEVQLSKLPVDNRSLLLPNALHTLPL